MSIIRTVQCPCALLRLSLEILPNGEGNNRKTDFYTAVVLILSNILVLQNFQPRRQWCIKTLLP